MTWVAVILAGVILSDILFGQLVVIPEKANALIFKTFQTKNKQGKAKNRKRHRTRKIKYNYLSPSKFPYLQKNDHKIFKNVYRTREIITT